MTTGCAHECLPGFSPRLMLIAFSLASCTSCLPSPGSSVPGHLREGLTLAAASQLSTQDSLATSRPPWLQNVSGNSFTGEDVELWLCESYDRPITLAKMLVRQFSVMDADGRSLAWETRSVDDSKCGPMFIVGIHGANAKDVLRVRGLISHGEFDYDVDAVFERTEPSHASDRWKLLSHEIKLRTVQSRPTAVVSPPE